MNELKFTSKNCGISFGLSDTSLNFSMKKPLLCPHCGAYQDGVIAERKLWPKDKDIYYGTICYRCTHCSRLYLVTIEIYPSKKTTEFGAFYPPVSLSYENEVLASSFPRFIDAFNQALRAEARGDIELSAIGYRQALECLVKDYAIDVLKENREEVVKKSLCNAISDYLGEKELIVTADVVRILGNDYAHYERKYPEYDFALLKRYMEIFIKIIETKVLINNPPVSRS